MRPTRPVPKSAIVPGSGFTDGLPPGVGPPGVGPPGVGRPGVGSPLPPGSGSLGFDGGVSSSPSPAPGAAGSPPPEDEPPPADEPPPEDEPPPADGLGARGAGSAAFGLVDSFTPGSLRATTAVSAVVPLWPNGLIVRHKPPSEAEPLEEPPSFELRRDDPRPHGVQRLTAAAWRLVPERAAASADLDEVPISGSVGL